MEKEKCEVFQKAFPIKDVFFLKNVEIDSCKQSAMRCPAVGTVRCHRPEGNTSTG